MSEDPQSHTEQGSVPQELKVADAAGDAAVSEVVAPVSIDYKDTVKGPDGDKDPATQQWREENWSQDADRAISTVDKFDRDKAAELRQLAQNKKNLGVLNENDTSVVRGLEDRAKEFDADADFAEAKYEKKYDFDKAKQIKIDEAKVSLPHKLEPLSPAEKSEARQLKSDIEYINRELKTAKSEYEHFRKVEDQILKALDTEIEISDLLDTYGNEGDRRPTDDELAEIRSKRVAYEELLNNALSKFRNNSRIQADIVLRGQDNLEKSQADAAKHYDERQGQYYDTALEEMTDAGIKFEANNPPNPEIEQQEAA